MKRRGIIKTIIDGMAGLFVGPFRKYKRVKPNDDGWIVLAMQLPHAAFKMRFKPEGNWDKKGDTFILIDYVEIIPYEDFDVFANNVIERKRNG